MNTRRSVRLTEGQLWALIQMCEASVLDPDSMNRSERTGLERLQRAHAEMFQARKKQERMSR